MGLDPDINELKGFISNTRKKIDESPDKAKTEFEEKIQSLFQKKVINDSEKEKIIKAFRERSFKIDPPSIEALSSVTNRERLISMILNLARSFEVDSDDSDEDSGIGTSLSPSDLSSSAISKESELAKLSPEVKKAAEDLKKHFEAKTGSHQLPEGSISLEFSVQEGITPPLAQNELKEDEGSKEKKLNPQFWADYIDSSRSQNTKIHFSDDERTVELNARSVEEGRQIVEEANHLALNLSQNQQDPGAVLSLRNNILYQLSQGPALAIIGELKGEIKIFSLETYPDDNGKRLEIKITPTVEITPIKRDGKVITNAFHVSFKASLDIQYKLSFEGGESAQIGRVEAAADYDVEVRDFKNRTDASPLAEISNLHSSYFFEPIKILPESEKPTLVAEISLFFKRFLGGFNSK